MKIREFIQGREISYDAVRKYIGNHPEKFKGHTGTANNIVLDEVAVKLLDRKYPMPAPVQVVQDTASIEKLNLLQEKYISLLEKNNHLMQQLAIAKLQEHQHLLLEQDLKKKEEELRKKQNDKDILENEYKDLYNAYQDVNDENVRLKNELQKEKNKKWYQKILR